MNVTTHERPGVYSVYDASSIVRATAGNKIAAVAALCAAGEPGSVYRLTRFDQAVSAFGGDATLTELIRLLFLGGAAAVVAVPVADEEDYIDAFAAISAVTDVSIVVCDCTTPSVQQTLRDQVSADSDARRERIAVLCAPEGESVTNLVARAASLNHPRVILTAPGGAAVAAAVAGAIAGNTDPAVPLGGAVLPGLTGISAQYSDTELDALIRGGVTPVETLAGQVSIVRGVTTKTTSGGAPDATWREATTILIVDEVIPGIRSALRARFARAKNTEQSRGAIRSQVVLELENRLAREMIAGYDGVTVTALEENPTVCLVEFSFTVTHGLNQIWLRAHITI